MNLLKGASLAKLTSSRRGINQFVLSIFFHSMETSTVHHVKKTHYVTKSQPARSTTVTVTTTSSSGSSRMNCAWFWMIIWFIILIVFALPIGLLCAILFVLFSPFAACCNGCSELMRLLDQGLKLPQTCSVNMVAGKSPC